MTPATVQVQEEIFYTDLHLDNPIEMCRDEVMELTKQREATPGDQRSQNIRFLGDIFDFEYSEARDALQKLFDWFWAVWINFIINGNHEKKTTKNQLMFFKNYLGELTVCAHGHLEADPVRWIAYILKPLAKGFKLWFKRKFVATAIAEWENAHPQDKPDFIKRAVALAKSNNCKYYICGHFHPQNIVVIDSENIRIIVLPRGKTVLDANRLMDLQRTA